MSSGRAVRVDVGANETVLLDAASFNLDPQSKHLVVRDGGGLVVAMFTRWDHVYYVDVP